MIGQPVANVCFTVIVSAVFALSSPIFRYEQGLPDGYTEALNLEGGLDKLKTLKLSLVLNTLLSAFLCLINVIVKLTKEESNLNLALFKCKKKKTDETSINTV